MTKDELNALNKRELESLVSQVQRRLDELKREKTKLLAELYSKFHAHEPIEFYGQEVHVIGINENFGPLQGSTSFHLGNGSIIVINKF